MTFDGLTREDRLERALRVLIETPTTRQFLEQWDPKGLAQAIRALTVCSICGQGPNHEPASEHKSSCVYWKSDEPLHDTI